MEKRSFLSIAFGVLLILGIAGACFAGVEPSPFEPEIKKLHSIELTLDAINKRLVNVKGFETESEGAINILEAIAKKMQGINTRLEEVLLVLPPPTTEGAYIGQDEAILALGNIRDDSNGAYYVVEEIVSRMGVEPSPFLPLFGNVSIKIIEGINVHVAPVLPPLQPPQLPQILN